MMPPGLFLPKNSACGPRRTSICFRSIWAARRIWAELIGTPSIFEDTAWSMKAMESPEPMPRSEIVPPIAPELSPV